MLRSCCCCSMFCVLQDVRSAGAVSFWNIKYEQPTEKRQSCKILKSVSELQHFSCYSHCVMCLCSQISSETFKQTKHSTGCQNVKQLLTINSDQCNLSPVKCPVGEVADNFVSCVHWLWRHNVSTRSAWLHYSCELGRCGCWWRGRWLVVLAASFPCLAFCIFCPVTMILQMSNVTKSVRTNHITTHWLHCSYYKVHNVFMKQTRNVYAMCKTCPRNGHTMFKTQQMVPVP
jgi:hypothetical protein